MKEKQMSIHLRCPWCEGSETLADGKGKVTISVQCSKCKHIYNFTVMLRFFFITMCFYFFEKRNGE